jgi:hypothetical protein
MTCDTAETGDTDCLLPPSTRAGAVVGVPPPRSGNDHLAATAVDKARDGKPEQLAMPWRPW